MNAPGNILSIPQKARLRVEDFILLAENGAFDAYAKTELIDGEIYFMSAQFSRHARVKSRLLVALANRLAEIGSDLEAVSEVSVRAADDSMPEPDIVLTRWRGDGAVPADSVALVVEVADSTFDYDIGRKSDLYAAAGIPEYWVIDLDESRALMHDHPDADGYHGQFDVLLGEPLVAATIAGLEVGSGTLLG